MNFFSILSKNKIYYLSSYNSKSSHKNEHLRTSKPVLSPSYRLELRLTLTADRSRFGKQTKRETECKMNKSLYLCVTVIVLVVLLSAEASGKTTSPFLSRLCQKCDYCNSDPGCDGCAKCSQCFGGDQTSKVIFERCKDIHHLKYFRQNNSIDDL